MRNAHWNNPYAPSLLTGYDMSEQQTKPALIGSHKLFPNKEESTKIKTLFRN